MKTLRIFISSPGDVRQERLIAKRVIHKLSKEFSSVAIIEPLLWEDMPLPPTKDFQSGIDDIVQSIHIDIAVFVLWSRLGSPLGQNFKREDGTIYSSGTEYEYDVMLSANKNTGSPDILAYIKTASTKNLIGSLTDNDIDEFLRQKQELEKFIKKNFYDDETNTTYGAHFKFEKPTSFENQLTTHLRSLIYKRVGGENQRVEWNGNPYVGLRSFTYEERDIFYGRSRVINNIMDRLIQTLPDGAPTLFVLGKSGSGKSSLVRAGLFPDICDYDLIPNNSWKRYDIHPNEYNRSFYEGLTDIVFELFPDLEKDPCGDDLKKGIPDNYDSRHIINRFRQLPILPKNEDSNIIPLIFVDQFEELFTNSQFSDEDKKKAIHLLRIISESKRIWLIFSMRNDFYYEFASFPNLAAMKETAIIYDVPTLFSSEYQEIVEEPAKKAGIEWEMNENGEKLSRYIANEISSKYKDLPLVEFALNQLYDKKNKQNVITFSAYEEIGHLKGAIVQYADNFYHNLSSKEQQLFYQILGRLITIAGQAKNFYTRKTVRIDDLPTEELRDFSRRLINSHLFTADKDADGRPTITIAHEVLLSACPAISSWINENQKFIQINEYYEIQAKHWINSGKQNRNLLTHEIDINESEYFLYKWSDFASQNVKRFINTSIKTKRRKWNISLSIIDVLSFLIVSLGGYYTFIDNSNEPNYYGEKFLAVVEVVLLCCSIVANFIQRKWIKYSIAWRKRICQLWGSALLVVLLDFVLSIFYIKPEDKNYLWINALLPTFVIISFLFILLNYLITRRWDSGRLDEIKQDNYRFSTIKSYLRMIVIISAIISSISVIVVLYELMDFSNKEAKLNNALEISQTTLSALDNITTNIENPRLTQIVTEYEINAYDKLSQLFSEDSVTVYDFKYAELSNRLGFPENAISRIEGKKYLDASDKYLSTILNYRLGHYEKIEKYLNDFSFMPLDSITNIWKIVQWSIILNHYRSSEFLDSALVRRPIDTPFDSVYIRLFTLQIKFNNDQLKLDDFVNSTSFIYYQAGERSEELKEWMSDYIWNKEGSSMFSSNELSALLGDENQQLYTTIADSSIIFSCIDSMMAHNWRGLISDSVLFTTEFIPTTRVFRRRYCTLNEDGAWDTQFVVVCHYRFKQTNDGLIFEHYSYDTHRRIAFLVQSVDEEQISLYQLLPIESKGTELILYQSDEFLQNIN